LPIPETTIAAAATQMLGAIGPRDRAARGAGEERAAEQQPKARGSPHQPVAEGARVERALGQHDLRDVDAAARDHRDVPDDEDDEQRIAVAHERDPVDEVAQVPARERPCALQEPRRDAGEQQRRDREADRVDPVGEVRPGDGDERAAEQRPRGRRQPLARLEQEVGRVELLLGDEVRHPGEHGGPEEGVPEPGEQREQHDRDRAVDERQRCEDGDPQHVGGDHQPLARVPVDERPADEAD
jgi:hypothetical protein